MKIELDTQTTQDPNVFGGLLKEHLLKDGPIDFEIDPKFKKVNASSPSGQLILKALGLSLTDLSEKLENILDADLINKVTKAHAERILLAKNNLYSNGDLLIGFINREDLKILAIVEKERAAITQDFRNRYSWKWSF